MTEAREEPEDAHQAHTELEQVLRDLGRLQRDLKDNAKRGFKDDTKVAEFERLQRSGLASHAVVERHNRVWQQKVTWLDTCVVACAVVCMASLIVAVTLGLDSLGYANYFSYEPDDLVAERNATEAWCFQVACIDNQTCDAWNQWMLTTDRATGWDRRCGVSCGGVAACTPAMQLDCTDQCVSTWSRLAWVEKHTAPDGKQQYQRGVATITSCAVTFVLGGVLLCYVAPKKDAALRQVLGVGETNVLYQSVASLQE